MGGGERLGLTRKCNFSSFLRIRQFSKEQVKPFCIWKTDHQLLGAATNTLMGNCSKAPT